MAEESQSPVVRTMLLALVALACVALAGWLVGARVALSAGTDLGESGVAVVGGLTVLAVCLVVPLGLAGRLLGMLAKASPHRPTVSLGTLSAWNLGVIAVLLGVFPTRSAEALAAHGDWIPGTTGTPLTQAASMLAERLGAAPVAQPPQALAADPAELAGAAPDEAMGGSGLDGQGQDGAVGEAARLEAPPPTPWNPEQLFAQRADSVVVVQTRSPLPEDHPLLKMLQGMGMDAMEGHGSGFVVDAQEGLVVTNHHVIDSASEAVVRTRDGRQLGPVRVVASDPANDLALLQVTVEGVLTLAPLADPGAVGVGARTWAIGAPLGLEHSLTEGIVSGHRDMQGTRFLQMQTTIAPGSSGGPLFDDHGRVVGVNTATRSPGLNLAVQVDHVHELLAAPRDAEAEPLLALSPGYEVERLEVHGEELLPTTRQSLAEVAELLGRKTFSCFDELPDGMAVGVWVPSRMGGNPVLGGNQPEVSLECVERDLRMLAFPVQAAVMQGQLSADLHLELEVVRKADDARVSVSLFLGGEEAPAVLTDGTLGLEAVTDQAGRSDQDQSASSTSGP